MQLRRLEVKAFRKLRHVVVDGLGPGLNVIVGDNEAGKSTLVAALRTVLFERHRVGGKVLEAMLPHGGGVRPEIAVDFVLGGAPYRLRKAFNQRPEAALTLPTGQTVVGEAVEDRLADLLGFTASPGRGSQPDEHQGIHGLLWVDQGLAHQPLAAGASRGSLAAALEHEVGQVLGGERGRQLLARAEARRDAFWDKREKPRGAFRQLSDSIETLEAQRAELASRLARHEAQEAALAAATETLAVFAREGRLPAAVQAASAAARRLADAERLEAGVADLRGASLRARVDRESAADRVIERRSAVDRAERAATAASDTADAAAHAATLLAAATAQAEVAAAADGMAHTAVSSAEARVEAVEHRREQAAARAELARLSGVLAEAEATLTRRDAARAVMAGIGVTVAALAGLDRLCALRDTAKAQRDAASVRITMESAAVGIVLVDGAPHPRGLPLLLAGDAVLDLPGFGRVRVEPGGGVGRLAAELAAREAAVDDALRALGQPSRAASAAALAERTAAEASVKADEALLRIVAPAGVAALRQSGEALAVKVAALPDAGAALSEDDVVALREERSAARQAAAHADRASRAAATAREAAAHEAVRRTGRAEAAAQEREAAARMLAGARAAATDEALQQKLDAAERALTLAAAALATAAAALAGAEPAAARAASTAAADHEAALRARIDTLTRDKRDIEVELNTLGQEGYGEQLAEVEQQLAAARRRLAALTLEAGASRLLHRTLETARQDSKDRWLGPVRDRVQPYLGVIQPGGSLVLNETTFGIEHLVRDGIAEPFDSLSVGAREQVAVITRLALADILRSAGQPATIILDDALVNTDEVRLAGMHRVLQRAAAKMQVLVLTCRAADFAALGVPVLRLTQEPPGTQAEPIRRRA